MKSILQEASSIERAIDKAWNEAGKPREFTIKVLDAGEKNFFGLTKRPAVISILYSPKKERTRGDGKITSSASRSQAEKSGHVVRDRKERKERSSQRTSSESRSDSRGESRSRSRSNGYRDATDDVRTRRRDSRSPHGSPRSNTSRSSAPSSRSRSKSSQDTQYNDGRTRPSAKLEWDSEWKNFVQKELEAVLALMNISVPFEIVTHQKIMNILFVDNVVPSAEEQRMVFASLSYLAIQLLKREYRDRFIGFKIIVTIKGMAAAVQSKPRSRSRRTDRPERSERSSSRRSERSSRSERRKNHGHDLSLEDEQRAFARKQLEAEQEESYDYDVDAISSALDTAIEAGDPIEPVAAEDNIYDFHNGADNKSDNKKEERKSRQRDARSSRESASQQGSGRRPDPKEIIRIAVPTAEKKKEEK